jgi:AcrR family transcriptional regulator
MAKGITRDAIVDAALAVLDDVGMDGLTVRAVAARLDVKAPALYWHVRDKKALLDEMGTRVWTEIGRAVPVLGGAASAGGEVDAGDATGDAPGGEDAADASAAAAASIPSVDGWRDALEQYAQATRRGLLAHRDGARAFSGTALTDASMLRGQEAGLAWMETQGFTVEATTDAVALLTSFTVGSCIEEQERAQAPAGTYDLEKRDAAVDAASHPRVAASGRYGYGGSADERFSAQLEVVLNGIASLRTASTLL